MNIHLLNGLGASAALKHVFRRELDHQVPLIYDDFSYGPLAHLSTEQGQQERYEWLKERDLLLTDHYLADFKQVIKDVQCSDSIFLWYTENASELTSLLFFINEIIDHQRVYLIEAGTLYHQLNSDSAVQRYVSQSDEISPKQLKEIFHLSPKETLSKEVLAKYEQQWQVLDQRSTFRLLIEGRLTSVNEDYYDEWIYSLIEELGGGEYINAVIIIGHMMGYAEQPVSDNYLYYRLLQLIKQRRVKSRKYSKRLMGIQVKINQ